MILSVSLCLVRTRLCLCSAFILTNPLELMLPLV